MENIIFEGEVVGGVIERNGQKMDVVMMPFLGFEPDETTAQWESLRVIYNFRFGKPKDLENTGSVCLSGFRQGIIIH